MATQLLTDSRRETGSQLCSNVINEGRNMSSPIIRTAHWYEFLLGKTALHVAARRGCLQVMGAFACWNYAHVGAGKRRPDIPSLFPHRRPIRMLNRPCFQGSI